MKTGSRMEKYDSDTPEYKSRTELKKDLYQSTFISNYQEIDLNSNISVLNNSGDDVNIDKIREMLDKKYRDNLPKRKSIDITSEHLDDYKNEDKKYDTKEYDINEIIAKAKSEQRVDYLQDRLKKLHNTNSDILASLNIGIEPDHEEEKELMTLINTITELELRNQENSQKEASDLLDLSKTEELTETVKENTFFTGNMKVLEKDFEDYSDFEEDLKSNSVLIKVLVFLFIVIILGLALFVLNNYLNIF